MSHVVNRLLVWSGGLALLSMVGCASQRQYAGPAQTQLRSAEGAVRTAQVRGADGYPKAAPFLRVAQQEMAAGRISMDRGAYRDANWWFARAAADGGLSQAVAERSRMEDAAARTESYLDHARAAAAQPEP